MGTQSGARNDGPMAEINITPFTDVLLVLLIIFMILASLTTPPGFQKELTPPCHGCNAVIHLKDIQVLIGATGAITIDGEQVALSQLYDRMAKAVSSHTGRSGFSTHITLTANAATPYNVVIKVLDAARQAGDDDVGLISNND